MGRLGGSGHGKIWLTGVTMLIGLTFAVASASAMIAPTHPRLLLTPPDVAAIRENLGKYPMFDAAVAQARAEVEKALQTPIQVPIPRDAAGATHERHKQNYVEMQLAGFLYQVTGDRRCAAFVKDMLLQYAELYPKLGPHPAGKGPAAGRLFWQTLNEAVWLVNASQAYDCVYEALTVDERTRIEASVLRPMAKFLSEDRVAEFDRIHNHGTWAATAVGIVGYAMGDDTLVQKALRGSKRDGSAGYLRQLDELFSPDGYYVEGPYYARYALMPFLLFAEVIDHNDPTVNVFGRRSDLLRRAVYAVIQQTSPTGTFIPFNDALKDKDIRSEEVVLAVDLVYARYPRDPALLSIARRQDGVSLDASGLEMAKALASTPNPPVFPFASVEFRDGPKGESGGVGILRTGTARDASLVLLKYTAFGMEHGHYDKLGLIYYDQGREIVADYGSARFLNVEQKDGGRYLRENGSFAKQTIAHNTVTVDERSNYGGSYAKAEHEHSERQFFDASDPNFQVMSAVDRTAYPGVAMQRTIATIRDPRLLFPVVVDVFRLTSATAHRYDYPLYYQGQFLHTNVPLTRHISERPVLGDKSGYQHLWVAAEGQAQGAIAFTWMNGDRYYTATSAADPTTRVFFLQIGANDPEFDLRNEPAIMLRQDGQSSHVFATVIEPHGRWDGVREQTFGGEPTIRSVSVLAATDEGSVVRITGEGGLVWTLMIANAQPAVAGGHKVTAGNDTFTWEGNAALQRN
jgi:oligo-alginate lyase